MDDTRIVELVNRACRNLIERDSDLLIDNLNERSLCHKLACYLTQRFQDYDVDVEYNGNFGTNDNRKRMPIEESQTEARIIPDIIIHERRSHERNLCMIEIKKGDVSTTRQNHDFEKLKYATSTNDELNYQLGIFIVFENRDRSNLEYEFFLFKNGNQVPTVG